MSKKAEADATEEVQSKSKAMLETLKAYRDLAIGGGALIAALAGILKPTDTTATKQSFDYTQEALKQLAADNAKTHDDLVRLHTFIVSYVRKHNELEQLELSQMHNAAPPAARPVGRARPRAPISGSAGGVMDPMIAEGSLDLPAQAQQIMEEFPDLPEIEAQKNTFKTESFDDVIAE